MSKEQEQHLREYANNGNIEKVKELLAAGVDPDARDSQGFTALEYANNSYPHIPDKDHLAVVRALVEGGADVNAAAENGQTPIFTAAAEGLYDVVVYLHESGADVDARLETGATALFDIPQGITNRPFNFQVTIQQDGETVTLTDPDEIRQAIGSHPDDEYRARLNTAVYLIDQGLDVNARLQETGQTALFHSADLGAEEIVALILAAAGDPNVRDKWGLTPLHFACRKGHPGCVRQLIAGGADIDVQENYGFTPLHEAAENNHLEAARLLVEKGADHTLGLTKAYQSYPAGSTPLDIARKADRRKTAKYLGGIS